MTRLLWLTFFGASRMSHEVEHHVHESPLSMTGVLMLLALLSVVGGYIALPHFLEPQLPLPQVVPALEHYEHTLLYVSIALALGGVGLAVFIYSDRVPRGRSRAHLRAGACAAERQVLRGRTLRSSAGTAAGVDLGERVAQGR